MIELDETTKKNVLNKILVSKELRLSKTYQDLLKYLFEYSIQGKSPKESTVAMEFFNKGSNFNPAEQSTVRFHIYKLRKKLDQYYRTEGADERFRLTIPRGHYELHFIDVRDRAFHNPKLLVKRLSAREKRIYGLFALVTTLFFVFFYLWISTPKVKAPIPRDDAIWSGFFANHLPTNLVIGDYFVFEEYDPDTKKYRRIMDYYVDSPQKFKNYVQSYPNKQLQFFSLGELPHNSVFNLQDLIHVFYSFSKSFTLKMASNLASKDIKGYNNIYIGDFRNMRLFGDLIKIIPLQFLPITGAKRAVTIFNNKFEPTDTLQTSTLWKEDEYNLDYGIFAKLPGLTIENYIIFTGFGYMSQIEIIRMFSSRARLEKLEQKIEEQMNEVPDYMAIIFEVAGYQRIGYNIEIKYLKKINPGRFRAAFRELLTQNNNP